LPENPANIILSGQIGLIINGWEELIMTGDFRVAILCLLFLICPAEVLSENRLNTNTDYSVKIAVTVNNSDYIVGKLEYSNHKGVFPLELVTIGQALGDIHIQPYVFDIIEIIVILPNVHQIKCRPLNNKYWDGSMILGTIDFRNELKPQVTLVWESGHPYLSNITVKGNEFHKKYCPEIWLGH